MSDIEEILKKQQELARLQKELEAQKLKAGASIQEEQGKIIEQIRSLAGRLEALNIDLKRLDLPPNETINPLLEALKRLPSARARASSKASLKTEVPSAKGETPEPAAKATGQKPARANILEAKAGSARKTPLKPQPEDRLEPAPEEPVVVPLLGPLAAALEPEAHEEGNGKEEGELPSGCRMSLIGKARLQVNYRGGAVVVSSPSVEPGSDLGDFLREQGMSAADRQRVGNKAAEMLVKKAKQ